MPSSKHRAGSRPASAKPRRPASAGRARPSSAVPFKAPEPALEVCAVCKDQPLVFHECPDCSARYCASGCLHSWYEHSKCARAAPMKVPVVSSEEDYIKATLPDKAEVEFGLSRAAGGVVIADHQEEKRRWSISSVDGWVLGQPGPGQQWRPASGVELTLEELGRCRSCKAPLHMQEYICNRAARAQSGVGPAGSGVQRPRVKTFEASTQTDVEFAEAEVQATATTAHQEVQATPPAEFAHVQSQAAIAGHMLASLALPAEASAGALAEMRLTAEPMVAAAKVRGALAAVARGASTESNAGNWAAQRRHADFALRGLGAQEMLDDQADCSRALGHRMRTVAPPEGQEAEAPRSPSKVQLQESASSTLASAALAALRKAEPPAPGPTPFAERDPESSAEAVFWAAGREEASVGQAHLHVALANVAAMLCTPVQSLQVMPAMTALAQLLPSAAEGGMPSWRSVANSESWPSGAGRPGGDVKPSGWPELKESLTTLFHLAAGAPGNEPPYQDAEGVDHSPASLLFRAVEAIARLALKLDAQATAREDAQVAQQAALAAPPPPPPPPPPPGGEMSSAVDAFLSQGSPANPVAASAVDAYLQQGTTAPLENPFAPGRARPAFGAGALGPGGGSTSLTLGPVGGCAGFGCGPVGGGCGGGGGLGGCGGCGGGGGFGGLGGCGCGSSLGGGCEGSGPAGGGGGQVDPARAMQDLFKTKRR